MICYWILSLVSSLLIAKPRRSVEQLYFSIVLFANNPILNPLSESVCGVPPDNFPQ